MLLRLILRISCRLLERACGGQYSSTQIAPLSGFALEHEKSRGACWQDFRVVPLGARGVTKVCFHEITIQYCSGWLLVGVIIKYREVRMVVAFHYAEFIGRHIRSCGY